MADYNKQIAQALENANEIHKELRGVIKQNGESTTRHNWIMVILTVVIIALTAVNIWLNFRPQPEQETAGQYAIAANELGVYVLDTKTTDFWIDSIGSGGVYYYGTFKTRK